MIHKRISILAAEHPFEATLLRILFAVLAVLLLGYLYFVGASVLNIIARKEATASATKLESAIADMEQQYFTLSQNVDSTKASSLGLSPVAGTHYVYRPGNAASLGVITRNAI